jgi:hypothetical protein
VPGQGRARPPSTHRMRYLRARFTEVRDRRPCMLASKAHHRTRRAPSPTRSAEWCPNSSAANTGVQAIAAGGVHRLAVTGDRSVWGWGSNAYGQVGNNTGSTQASPSSRPGQCPAAGHNLDPPPGRELGRAECVGVLDHKVIVHRSELPSLVVLSGSLPIVQDEIAVDPEPSLSERPGIPRPEWMA